MFVESSDSPEVDADDAFCEVSSRFVDASGPLDLPRRKRLPMESVCSLTCGDNVRTSARSVGIAGESTTEIPALLKVHSIKLLNRGIAIIV